MEYKHKAIRLDGCIWCEKHYEPDKSMGARKGRHFCTIVMTNNDYTPIEFEEISNLSDDGSLNNFCRFPSWCPLKDYKEVTE